MANNHVEKDSEVQIQIINLANELEKQLESFQKLALDAKPLCGEITEKFLQKTLDYQSNAEIDLEEVILLAISLAEKGMDLGFIFASRGMELAFEFASRGEEVGPMANRVLFMATQIGVMADRIGEMADRILFMADKIVEFGDKILYVSQLIIYTEQLIINAGTLITEIIRILSDLILTLVALVTDNNTYLQLRIEHLKNNQSLPLVYENMNLMLRNMHEFSLKLLDNEARQNENQLKIRELQIKLRQETLRANECFCPCFCVAPKQDSEQDLENEQQFSENQDSSGS